MLRTITAILVSAALAMAAAPTIGTISSNGRFHINGAEVWNQSSLFEGASVQTKASASRLLFRNGTDIRLGASSQGRVYSNRLILDSGALEGLLPRNFQVETSTLGLRVQGENSRAHINVNDGTITIASLQGPLMVRGSEGILLASVQEGSAVQLSQAQGATAGTKLTGVVQHENKTYFLTDETTGIRVEIRGMDVAKYVGKRVTITGEVDTTAVAQSGAEHVVRVTRFEVPTTTATTGTGLGTGMSTGAKVGIISGIAVAAGTTTGLVVSGDGENKPTASPEPGAGN